MDGLQVGNEPIEGGLVKGAVEGEGGEDGKGELCEGGLERHVLGWGYGAEQKVSLQSTCSYVK